MQSKLDFFVLIVKRLYFIFKVGCPTSKLYGDLSTTGDYNVNIDCNSDCGCPVSRPQPVCSKGSFFCSHGFLAFLCPDLSQFALKVAFFCSHGFLAFLCADFGQSFLKQAVFLLTWLFGCPLSRLTLASLL